MRRAGILLILSALLAAPFFYRPAGPSLCMSRRIGASCPGCGMVRSICALAEGRVADSLRFHLFGPLVYAVVATLWALALHGLVRGRDLRAPDGPAFQYALVVTLVLLIGYWIARVAAGVDP